LPSTRPDPLRLVVIVAITAALTVRAVFWLTDPSATQTSDSSTEHESTPPRSAGAISGAVYDEHNRPAPDRQVRLLRADPDAAVVIDASIDTSTTRTDAAGRYQFDRLPSDRYLVMAAFYIEATARVFHPSALRIAEATPIDLQDAERRTDVDLRYRPAQRSTIEGVVQPADGTAVKLIVTLIPRGIGEPERLRLTTTTDDEGRFSLGPVPGDDYWVVAHTRVRGTRESDAPIASRPYAGVADVSTNGVAPAHVTIVARPAMRVSAKLIFTGPADSPRPDLPHALAIVQLRGRDRLSRALLRVIDTPVRASGDIVTMHGVPAGRYSLVIEPPPPWWLDAARRGSGWPDRHIDIQDGSDVEDIELTFTDDSQTISTGASRRR
jgi:hypothetical protein